MSLLSLVSTYGCTLFCQICQKRGEHMTATSMGGISGCLEFISGTADGECATQNDYLIKLCGFIGGMMRGERVTLRRGVRKHDNRQHGNYVRSWSFRWSWNIKQCHPIICTFRVDVNSMVLVLLCVENDENLYENHKVS